MVPWCRATRVSLCGPGISNSNVDILLITIEIHTLTALSIDHRALIAWVGWRDAGVV